jgi:hypothetical protein
VKDFLGRETRSPMSLRLASGKGCGNPKQGWQEQFPRQRLEKKAPGLSIARR